MALYLHDLREILTSPEKDPIILLTSIEENRSSSNYRTTKGYTARLDWYDRGGCDRGVLGMKWFQYGIRIRSNLSQRSRWNPLEVTTDFFEECRKHPILYIPAEGYKRQYYFFECEEIVFRDENGRYIWATKGDGQIVVPQGVSVSIKRGKTRNS